MAWLIGAIATYGIITLLIGIAVLVYLVGNKQPGVETKEGEAHLAPHRYPMNPDDPPRGATPRARLIGAR